MNNMKVYMSVKIFGITMGVFSKEYWNDLSKEPIGDLPFTVGRYYSSKNKSGDEVSCGYETLARFLNREDAKTYYKNESCYLRK